MSLTIEHPPTLERAIVLPLEGERVAVDEVICGPAPLREASTHSIKKRPAMESSLPIDGRHY